MTFLRTQLARLAADSRGSVTVEAVLILPLLLWAYMAAFVYFDAFHTRKVNLSAAYTIADMLSRQQNTINIAYLNGLNTVYDYLTETPRPTGIRVSSVFWDNVNNVYKVQWSYATDLRPILTDVTINNYASQLPTIPVGDTLLVVETSLDYTPAFDVGIVAHTFTEFVATRPRFVAQVPFSNT